MVRSTMMTSRCPCRVGGRTDEAINCDLAVPAHSVSVFIIFPVSVLSNAGKNRSPIAVVQAHAPNESGGLGEPRQLAELLQIRKRSLQIGAVRRLFGGVLESAGGVADLGHPVTAGGPTQLMRHAR